MQVSEKKPVLDLFIAKLTLGKIIENIEIHFMNLSLNIKDIILLIPSKDINKTLNKITFLLNE